MYLIVRRGVENKIKNKIIAHIAIYVDYKKAFENCNLLNENSNLQDKYIYEVVKVMPLPKYENIETNNYDETYIHFTIGDLEHGLTEFKEFIGYGISDEMTAIEDSMELLQKKPEEKVGFAEIRMVK